MLSILDPIIFPDDCLILKSQDHYIYPIFKNGSSSLKQSGYTVVSPDEYADISEVTVFVREPFERYLSGVNTFVQHNPSYHQETLVHIINENLFLDRHFCLQFHWLVNLQRFTQAPIKLTPVSELNYVTDLHNNKCKNKSFREVFENHAELYFYLALDKVLFYDLIGQTVDFKQILTTIKQTWPDSYTEVIERSKQICSVLD
tara:strand:- start:522 stop:1127 length:606 start_codon:yes stop_codon:yes gene_type:complete